MCYDCRIGGKIMYCNQKYSGLVKGFLLGSLLIFSLMFVGKSLYKYQSPKNTISFEEAVNRLQSNRVREINLKNNQLELLDSENVRYSANISEGQKIELLQKGNTLNVAVTFSDEPSNPLVYLFQILFWLFFISPPVIVVLLLIIIKKMDARSVAK
jgi:ATP-dependent Zn protease